MLPLVSYYNPLSMTNAVQGNPGSLSIRHLPGLREVPKDDLVTILDTAQAFREGLDAHGNFPKSLSGVSVVNLFFENSTRTRLSFETAQKKLGASPMNFTASGSSAAKGETLRDTARNIESMGADVFVVRHSSAGVPQFLAQHTSAVIVNAGDGACEHPTQGLLDALTMRQHLGELEGREVTIIGDIRHSRVARSNIWALSTLGAKIRLWGPATLLPRSPEAFGPSVTVAKSIEAALDGADAVMLLRIQHERQSSGMLPSLREYRQSFGLDHARLKLARPQALVLHPGPINRGVEVVSEVADGPQSVILEQVTNGVAVRMACLHLLAGKKS
jgi:aspartate carbamoyltransferase catalytic subunit